MENLLGSFAHLMGMVIEFDQEGCMKGEPVKIHLREDAKPYCITTGRRIPFPLLPKVKTELELLEGEGIIVKVTQLTDRCVPIFSSKEKTWTCAFMHWPKKIQPHGQT